MPTPQLTDQTKSFYEIIFQSLVSAVWCKFFSVRGPAFHNCKTISLHTFVKPLDELSPTKGYVPFPPCPLAYLIFTTLQTQAYNRKGLRARTGEKQAHQWTVIYRPGSDTWDTGADRHYSWRWYWWSGAFKHIDFCIPAKTNVKKKTIFNNIVFSGDPENLWH